MFVMRFRPRFTRSATPSSWARQGVSEGCLTSRKHPVQMVMGRKIPLEKGMGIEGVFLESIHRLNWVVLEKDSLIHNTPPCPWIATPLQMGFREK